MLLYHTGPQVFQRSLTIACEMRKRQRERQLMPISHSHTHTNAHCNPGPFSKGSGVLYHWISSQLACYSSLHSPMYQTHNKTLFVFMILNPDLIFFDIAAVGLGEECANKDLRTNVSHMPVWPPHCQPGHITAFWENNPGFRGSSGCTNLDYRCVVKQFWRLSFIHRLG